MSKNVKNIEDLRNNLILVLEQLQKGKMEIPVVQASVKVSNAIIKTADLQLKSKQQFDDKTPIEFLNCN